MFRNPFKNNDMFFADSLREIYDLIDDISDELDALIIDVEEVKEVLRK
jgi:hypothetical protein